MLKLVPGAALSAAKTSSLLSLVAGEFTPAISRAWPEPHVEFLTAPAARRHLACMTLATGRHVPLRPLLTLRLRQAIRLALLNPPAGLARALTRLGETAWAAGDYRALLTLLAQPAAGKALRHAQAITPDMVRRLAALPSPLAPLAGLVLGMDDGACAVLCEAHAAIAFRDGAGRALATATGWAKAASAKALFAAVRDDLYPEPAAPPFPGTGRLKPLATKAALAEAAKRFRNCLRTQAPPYAASGWSAYYEWVGPPGAIVEIERDGLFGWRLTQVRLAGNAVMAEPDREDLMADLALMGVHMGWTCWELERAITAAGESAGRVRLRSREAARESAFSDD